MEHYIRHMQQHEKYKLAKQMAEVLTQNGAVSYGVASDILQLCINLLERSAVLRPLTASGTEMDSQKSRSMIDELAEFGIDGIPDNHCSIEGEIASNGALLLSVSAFSINGYLTSTKIPFSDFSENIASITDLKRLLIDTVYSKSAGCKEPVVK